MGPVIDIGTGLMVAFSDWGDALTAAGHDPTKIDYAIPQTWADREQGANIHREALRVVSAGDSRPWSMIEEEVWSTRAHEFFPRAFWSYEGSLFGNPLFISQIEVELKTLIWHKLSNLIVAYDQDGLFNRI